MGIEGRPGQPPDSSDAPESGRRPDGSPRRDIRAEEHDADLLHDDPTIRTRQTGVVRRFDDLARDTPELEEFQEFWYVRRNEVDAAGRDSGGAEDESDSDTRGTPARLASGENTSAPERLEAAKAEAILTDAGVDARDIWGDRPPTDAARQRAERVLSNSEYPASVRTRMVRWGCGIALENGGRDDPVTFASLYEYCKAAYESEKRAAAIAGPRKASLEAASAVERDTAGLAAQIVADRLRVAEMRQGPGEIDPATSTDRLVSGIRRSADALGFSTVDSAMYHARKHHAELPPAARNPGDPVGAYHAALRSTVREGDAVSIETSNRFGTKVVFRQTTTDAAVRGRIVLEAVVFVHTDGRVVVATYHRTTGD